MGLSLASMNTDALKLCERTHVLNVSSLGSHIACYDFIFVSKVVLDVPFLQQSQDDAAGFRRRQDNKGGFTVLMHLCEYLSVFLQSVKTPY